MIFLNYLHSLLVENHSKKQLVLLYQVYFINYHELSDVPFVNGFYIAERDLNNGFNLADSAFPNLRPENVSNDSGIILIYYHYV